MRWRQRPGRHLDCGAQALVNESVITENGVGVLVTSMGTTAVHGSNLAGNSTNDTNADPVEAEHELVHDVVLRRAAQQETSPAKLNWLREFEETANRGRPLDRHNLSAEAVEALLASL